MAYRTTTLFKQLGIFVLIIVIVNIDVHTTASDNFSNINLPRDHLKYYFNFYPKVAQKCRQDPSCPYKRHLDTLNCWGYEDDCDEKNSFPRSKCTGDHKGWVTTKEAQIETFYTQGDFGYVRDQRREMRLLCEPKYFEDSSMECSENFRFCRGRNILVNLTNLSTRTEPIRYNTDVLNPGEIGGFCKLNEKQLKENADHYNALQSWAPEIENFRELPRPPIIGNYCDVIIEKPTYIMKIDAAVNMYHHFCDFFNLYASQHVNQSHPSAFDTDNHILIWESYSYRSAFQHTFEAFTKNPIWDLKTFTGKVVCFKNLVLPLLPRMIFGLYYNTPLIYGCEKSGLFKAFSEHILHRLDIPLHNRSDDKICITLLSRDTRYRRILNENELIEALEKNPEYKVQKVVYNREMPFKKQLEITRNSDVFIGIHGAGLTHVMFLPDWASIFELYNCGDPSCYKDLSRLRGVRYFTWENDEKIYQQDSGGNADHGAYEKFTNYSFDVDEFLRMVRQATDYVKNNEIFRQFLRKNMKLFRNEL